MTAEWSEALKAVLIGAAAIIAVGAIVAMVLAHHIGGFFSTVEREAREEDERRDAASRSAEQKPSGE